MAEGTRTKTGERVWVVQREDDVEGQGGRYKVLRPAEDDDVQGHPYRHGLSPEDEDTEGQTRRSLEPAGEDDTIGHAFRHSISPEAIDAEQGLYLAVLDTDEDVTGQRLSRQHGLEAEDAEGQAKRS